MSRHIIPNAPESPPGRVTTVGWDAPLTTFFAMAFDPAPDDSDEETEVFWIGWMPNEIPTVEALDAALKQHRVELPSAVAEMLATDRTHEGDRSANPGRRIVDAMLAAHAEQDEPLIDPDCRDGKCESCVGGPCQHHCHQAEGEAAR